MHIRKMLNLPHPVSRKSFSMKTVNLAPVVLWGLEDFWERRLDGKKKLKGNDTFMSGWECRHQQ